MNKKLTDIRDLLYLQLNKLIEHPLVKKWEVYLALPEEKKISIMSDWNEYYMKCKQSPQGRNFYESRQYLRENNLRGVNDARKLSRDLPKNTVKKPTSSSVDPMELYFDPVVSHYRLLRSRIRDIDNQLERDSIFDL